MAGLEGRLSRELVPHQAGLVVRHPPGWWVVQRVGCLAGQQVRRQTGQLRFAGSMQ